MEVTFEIGPLPSEPARLWLREGLQIVAAMRADPDAVPFVVNHPMLDVIEMYFNLWWRAAEAETFRWGTQVESVVVEQVALQWRRIAAMDATHIAALRCSWPPPEAVPFHEALLAGVTGALSQDPHLVDLATDLRRRPPGTSFEVLGGWEPNLWR